jgi:hypothetical protein
MTFARANIDLLAARLRMLGELLERDGRAVWSTTADWQRGARAANLDPDARGNRTWTDPETGECYPVPNDPTGDAATDRDPAADMHDQLLAALAGIDSDAAVLWDLMHAATVRTPQPHKADKSRSHLIAEGWCVSCHRNDQHMTPIEERPTGGRYYAAMCRWCGSFAADYGRMPPTALLQLRHAGRRISVDEVAKALQAETDERRTGRKRRKGKRAA